jgi:hypothetical protein
MTYAGAKSELVKNLIRGVSWKDKTRREYVDDLIRLERYILTGPTGFADALFAADAERKIQPRNNDNLQGAKTRGI